MAGQDPHPRCAVTFPAERPARRGSGAGPAWRRWSSGSRPSARSSLSPRSSPRSSSRPCPGRRRCQLHLSPLPMVGWTRCGGERVAAAFECKGCTRSWTVVSDSHECDAMWALPKRCSVKKAFGGCTFLDFCFEPLFIWALYTIWAPRTEMGELSRVGVLAFPRVLARQSSEHRWSGPVVPAHLKFPFRSPLPIPTKAGAGSHQWHPRHNSAPTPLSKRCGTAWSAFI